LGNYLSTLERKKNLLLIDYIEECDWFSDSFLKTVANNCGSDELKFLANCRNSFYYDSYSDYLEVKLEKHLHQSAYEQFVIENILRDLDPELENLQRKDFFVKKPSFAIFLKYHFGKYGKSFKKGEFPDFNTWLLKRFRQNIGQQKNDISELGPVIKWLISFPVNSSDRNKYHSDNSD